MTERERWQPLGSMPFPALNIQTPQQPDLLQKFGQLQQLRNMQQESQQRAQIAPLQQQQAQQGIQSGGVQLQQQQQALKDQQATTAAMQSWNGQDYKDLVPLVLKHGGSAQAVFGLQKQASDYQHTVSETLKNNAEGGLAQVKTQEQLHDMKSGTIQGIMGASDQQLLQAITQGLKATPQGRSLLLRASSLPLGSSMMAALAAQIAAKNKKGEDQ